MYYDATTAYNAVMFDIALAMLGAGNQSHGYVLFLVGKKMKFIIEWKEQFSVRLLSSH